jgi:hypothetical protein
MARSTVVVPLLWPLQVAPPLLVARMAPLPPAAAQVLLLVQATPYRACVVPLLWRVHPPAEVGVLVAVAGTAVLVVGTGVLVTTGVLVAVAGTGVLVTIGVLVAGDVAVGVGVGAGGPGMAWTAPPSPTA